MHRGRPPPDCCQLKRVSCRIITSHMLEYTPAADLGGAAFKRLCVTWDQSRRQSDHRSQRRCGSLLPGALCVDYPTAQT